MGADLKVTEVFVCSVNNLDADDKEVVEATVNTVLQDPFDHDGEEAVDVQGLPDPTKGPFRKNAKKRTFWTPVGESSTK